MEAFNKCGQSKEGCLCAFNTCKVNSLVGVGWSDAYMGRQPIDDEDAENLIINVFGKKPVVLDMLKEQNGLKYLTDWLVGRSSVELL